MLKLLGAGAAAALFAITGCSSGTTSVEGADNDRVSWVRENLDPDMDPLICIGNPDGSDEVCTVAIADPLGKAIDTLREQGDLAEDGAEGLRCAIGPDSAPVCDEDGDGYVTVGDMIVPDEIESETTP